jgi:hypothetical protein
MQLAGSGEVAAVFAGPDLRRMGVPCRSRMTDAQLARVLRLTMRHPSTPQNQTLINKDFSRRAPRTF